MPSAVALAPPSAPLATDATRRDLVVYYFFAAELFVLLFLQKLGLPLGGAVAELIFFTLWGGVAVLLGFGQLRLNVVRTSLYAIFAFFAIVAHIGLGRPFSAPSLLQILFLYLPFCLEYRVGSETYQRCMRLFVHTMIFFAGVEFLQYLIQILASYRYWINLDNIIPNPFLYKNFAYMHPMQWGSKYMKPNAEVFLEPSILAQFLALGTITELVYWRRYWVIAIFLVAQLLTFSGTGIMLLAVCGPFIAVRLPPRWIVMTVGTGAAAMAVLFATGWAPLLLDRVIEFNQAGSSGYERFANPALTVQEFAAHQRSMFVGIGAGNLLEAKANEIFWASVKCMVEYGFATVVAFHVFLIYSLFSGAPSKTIAWGLLFMYSFLGGAFAVPIYPITCLLLGGLLRIRPPETGAASPARPVWNKAGKPPLGLARLSSPPGWNP